MPTISPVVIVCANAGLEITTQKATTRTAKHATAAQIDRLFFIEFPPTRARVMEICHNLNGDKKKLQKLPVAQAQKPPNSGRSTKLAPMQLESPITRLQSPLRTVPV
jgi:hypothetical protein